MFQTSLVELWNGTMFFREVWLRDNIEKALTSSPGSAWQYNFVLQIYVVRASSLLKGNDLNIISYCFEKYVLRKHMLMSSLDLVRNFKVQRFLFWPFCGGPSPRFPELLLAIPGIPNPYV
jgi:hypothetical protein